MTTLRELREAHDIEARAQHVMNYDRQEVARLEGELSAARANLSQSEDRHRRAHERVKLLERPHAED